MFKNIRAVLCLFVLTVFAATLFPAPARAGDPRLVGTYGDWSVYVFLEDGNKVCYMLSSPKKAEGKYSQRGDVYVMITDRPVESTRNVFSYMAGYGYKPNSDATLTIDGEKFTLFTKDETAWAPDAATDEKILKAISKGANMVVKGSSARGTVTTDTFSLKGSGQAHEALAKECGLQ